MGADIHVFTEIMLPNESELTNIDYFMYFKEGDAEGYSKLDAYEGRNSILFDVLQHKVPQNGYPKNPSKIFKEEWKSWKGCGGYGLNHITLQDLYYLWKESIKEVYASPFDFYDIEFSEARALYPFLNDLINHYISFKHHQVGSRFKTDFNRGEGDNVYVIYFFDR